jgi:hypothetical protein
VTAERFVIWSLRAMALGFFVVGLLFIIDPNGVLERTDDVGDEIGSFAPAPGTGAKLWLTLGFSYMMVITALALVAQSDIYRHRAMIAILVLAKTSSSLVALGYYLFDEDVFIYLLNFVVDGSLVLAAAWLWALTGRAAPAGTPP